ncbi:Cdk-activating kinase assembly factor MAT1/Tfb3 protein [Dioscorea alata]|uniref:Cdk-activating kinase assembly factor MAT1/Tfb3 protein n=1 Tax=Dioscorea alata TaxID=55571 RepID=A0ACB7WJ75_DIOAL|nr:Cdk-activating kinase assembly factor MAT1/Tfb3 protein [Dioscorea alata]
MMANLHARHGDDSDIVQTLNVMRMAGCQYSSMLSSRLQVYERVAKLEKVPQLLKVSFNDGILVDQASTSMLVMPYVQNSLLDDALQALREQGWKH